VAYRNTAHALVTIAKQARDAGQLGARALRVACPPR
jgi:hypothetical protein